VAHNRPQSLRMRHSVLFHVYVMKIASALGFSPLDLGPSTEQQNSRIHMLPPCQRLTKH
jgi:hypothetical protein